MYFINKKMSLLQHIVKLSIFSVSRIARWRIWTWDNKLPRSTQPSIPLGQVNQVQVWLAGVNAERAFTCVGWL